MLKRLPIIFITTLIGFICWQTAPTIAQDQAIRVGVVITSKGGQTSTYCVTLAPDKHTGFDALEATRADLSVERGALGVAVCGIQNVGCSVPADSCFCQCQGKQCNYWSYHYQDADKQWRYSGLGAADRKLKTGDIEGWLWSESSNMTPVGTLPPLSFDAICNAANSNSLESSTKNNAPIDPLTLVGYGAFGLAIIGVGGLLLWRRTHSR